VLRQVAEGKKTKEIAYRLKLSIKTIESHRAQLMKRLNIHDVAGVVRYALPGRLVRPEECLPRFQSDHPVTLTDALGVTRVFPDCDRDVGGDTVLSDFSETLGGCH